MIRVFGAELVVKRKAKVAFELELVSVSSGVYFLDAGGDVGDTAPLVVLHMLVPHPIEDIIGAVVLIDPPFFW